MTPSDRVFTLALFNRTEERDGLKVGAYVAVVIRGMMMERCGRVSLWGLHLRCDHLIM